MGTACIYVCIAKDRFVRIRCAQCTRDDVLVVAWLIFALVEWMRIPSFPYVEILKFRLLSRNITSQLVI